MPLLQDQQKEKEEAIQSASPNARKSRSRSGRRSGGSGDSAGRPFPAFVGPKGAYKDREPEYGSRSGWVEKKGWSGVAVTSTGLFPAEGKGVGRAGEGDGPRSRSEQKNNFREECEVLPSNWSFSDHSPLVSPRKDVVPVGGVEGKFGLGREEKSVSAREMEDMRVRQLEIELEEERVKERKRVERERERELARAREMADWAREGGQGDGAREQGDDDDLEFFDSVESGSWQGVGDGDGLESVSVKQVRVQMHACFFVCMLAYLPACLHFS